MYCPNCGTNINENAEVCTNCGVNVLTFGSKTINTSENKANIWVNLISLCCFPILGIIMYFVWKDQQPKTAKSALIFGIIGFVISIIIGIISVIIGIASEIMIEEDYYY